MNTILLLIGALIGAVSCLYYPATWNDVQNNLVPSCELGDQTRYVPMYIVPSTRLSILQDYRTRFYTPAPALISFVGQNDPVPAVRVVLNNPIPVSNYKQYIEFPSTFTIYQDGYTLPFRVSALYAPFADYQQSYPPAINVVYAVPDQTNQRPASPPKRILDPLEPIKSVQQQNVTILHFPETLAEPEVVYHIEDDDELGGRNPPVPVIPAGIVQSSAPTADNTIFINSKESPVLQLLRDEAQRMRYALRTQ